MSQRQRQRQRQHQRQRRRLGQLLSERESDWEMALDSDLVRVTRKMWTENEPQKALSNFRQQGKDVDKERKSKRKNDRKRERESWWWRMSGRGRDVTGTQCTVSMLVVICFLRCFLSCFHFFFFFRSQLLAECFTGVYVCVCLSVAVSLLL